MKNWTTSDIPSQKGRIAIITGTGGLGFEDALALSQAGCDVIIAGRNLQKGAEAVKKITNIIPTANIRFEQLDLASLDSISNFSIRIQNQIDNIDILINNAGIMVPPKRHETKDGFELQFGTNYLGHFALTAKLMPLLRKSQNARVITLSSVAAKDGVINFDDLQAKQYYNPMAVYSQSKLACLMFAFELQKRSHENKWNIHSIAAHPGIARTNLLHNAPGKRSLIGITRSLLWFLFQPVAQGALPTLFAATSPEAVAGAYYGPNKLYETRGFPTLAKVPSQAEDKQASKYLWDISEQLTHIKYK